jgi:nitrate reductase assembly molybdenum cofactor insertion protein NarJ
MEALRLTEAFGSMTMNQRQEYYLKTFDVQAVCYLDLGYLLFGDDYKRAQLLVNLQAEHKRAGVDCGTELADHLPNVLKLLAVTEDDDFANELGFVILIPSIRFMILKFGETENHYKSLLELLLEFLYRDFKGDDLTEYLVPEQNFTTARDFLLDSPKSVLCETMCYQRKKS